MKTIKLIKGEAFNSRQMFTEILSLPAQGCSIADMRRRIKILDAIEGSQGDELRIEDADFELLKSIFNGTQFRIAHKNVLAIADTLESAT
jgi:hypothetical protein